MKFFFLFFLFFTTAATADLEDHFKRITDRRGHHHSLRNIDFIYMINLDRRPEKYALCTERLNPYGIYPYRFSAVNGWELTTQDIQELGIRYKPWMTKGLGTCYDENKKPFDAQIEQEGINYYSHCMSLGAIGICLSHLSILQDAWDSHYETIWVMEDDVVPIRDPRLISDYIERLDRLVSKTGWDILFTDPDTKDQSGNYVPCFGFVWRPNFVPQNPERFGIRRDYSPEFRKVGARFGAYSMIVRRSGMKKILDYFKKNQLFLPFDIDFFYPNDIQLFTLTEDLVSTQPDALSDNAKPYYLNKEPIP